MNILVNLISILKDKKNSNIVVLFINSIFVLSALVIAYNFSPYPEFDELAYISHVETIVESPNYYYLGDRNRMPLFNYFLFSFYLIKLPDVDLYRVYQLANIFFTSVFSIWYCVKIKKFFKTSLAYFSCIVFTIFIPVFSYIHDVLVEPIFYVSFGLLFIFFIELLNELNFRNSIKFGAICLVVYSLKATGFFLLIISILFLITKKIVEDKKISFLELSKIFSSLLFFLLLASPYLYENYINYNKQIFYNVNSTFYVWYDTWEEVENGTKLYGDRVGWPKMPEEEIPSFSKYVESHSLKDIINRFTKGYTNILKYYFSINEFTGSLTLSLVILLLHLKIRMKKVDKMVVFEKTKLWTYYLSFISLFILTSTAWYQLTSSVQRFSILIFVPLYFLIFLYFDKLFNSGGDTAERKDFLFLVFGFIVTQTTIFVNYLI